MYERAESNRDIKTKEMLKVHFTMPCKRCHAMHNNHSTWIESSSSDMMHSWSRNTGFHTRSISDVITERERKRHTHDHQDKHPYIWSDERGLKTSHTDTYTLRGTIITIPVYRFLLFRVNDVLVPTIARLEYSLKGKKGRKRKGKGSQWKPPWEKGWLYMLSWPRKGIQLWTTKKEEKTINTTTKRRERQGEIWGQMIRRSLYRYYA